MSTNTRRLGLSVARVGAVALALGVGGYLVVTAQRRANPDPVDHAPTSESTPPIAVDAPAAPIATPADATATTTVEPGAGATPTSADYLPSSKVLVIQSPTAGTTEDPSFLFGSKSGVMAPIASDGRVGEPTTTVAPASPTPQPVFLPSSKSAALEPAAESRPLQFPAVVPEPVTPSAPKSEPLPFLPSSKSRPIGGDLRPVLRPAPQESKPAPTTPPKIESTPPKTDSPKPQQPKSQQARSQEASTPDHLR